MKAAEDIDTKRSEITICLMQIGWFYITKQFDEVIVRARKCCKTAKEIGHKEAEMTCYKMMALSCDALSQCDDAIRYSRMCLDIVLLYPQEADLKNDAEICAYMVLGSSHKFLKRYDEAILYTTVGLEIAQEVGEKHSEMKACMILGAVHVARKDYDDAILYESKSIEIAKDVGDRYVEMQASLILGEAYLNLHKQDDAFFHSKQCITIAKENRDRDSEVKALSLVGWVHYDLYQYDDAIGLGMTCIDLAKETGQKHLEIHPYLLLASACYMVDRLNDAMDYGKKCLSIAEESGKIDAEMEAYKMLGKVNLSLFKHDDGVMCSRKCLDIARKTRDKTGEMDALMMLGVAYFMVDQNNVALRYLGESNAIALEIGATSSEVLTCLLTKTVHSFQDMYNNGLSYFNELQEHSDELKSNSGLEEQLEIPLEEYFSLDEEEGVYHKNVGKQMIETLLGEIKYDDLEHLEKVFACCTTTTQAVYSVTRGDSSQALHGLQKYKMNDLLFVTALDVFVTGINAQMYLSQKRYVEALQSFKTLLSMSKKKYLKRLEVVCLFRIGLLHQTFGQFEEAEQSYRQAICIVEGLFDRLYNHDLLKISFIDVYIIYYKTLSQFLIKFSRNEEGFLALEHSRARVLRDIWLVNYGTKRPEKKEAKILLSDIQCLVTKSNYSILFYSIVFKELYTFVVNVDGLHFSRQTFEDCEIIDRAFKEMSARQAGKRKNRSLDVIDEIEDQEQIAECEEAQLLPPLLERNVYEEPWREEEETDLTTRLRELHQKLLGQVMSYTEQDEIVIITDGLLSKVPFAALLDPKTGRYLSETKKIRFVPSITTLKFLEERPGNVCPISDALIIGDPLVGRVMLNGMESYIGSLNNAREEALELANILGVEALIGEEATKTAVLEKLQQGVSIVHIAAHGNLEKATILLAPSAEIRETKIPDEEDYMLTMADVQQTQVRAQLVVLSCCHSGRGKIRAEGVVGMCRAFLASGARAVVASLWAIEDSATLTFMKLFYNHLKERKSASESLQMTMKDMRKSEEYSKPMYWAPFILMGADTTLHIS